MLKSLGQWTTPSLKSRKIIPTGLIVATMRQTNGDDRDGTEGEHPKWDAEQSGTV